MGRRQVCGAGQPRPDCAALVRAAALVGAAALARHCPLRLLWPGRRRAPGCRPPPPAWRAMPRRAAPSGRAARRTRPRPGPRRLHGARELGQQHLARLDISKLGDLRGGQGLAVEDAPLDHQKWVRLGEVTQALRGLDHVTGHECDRRRAGEQRRELVLQPGLLYRDLGQRVLHHGERGCLTQCSAQLAQLRHGQAAVLGQHRARRILETLGELGDRGHLFRVRHGPPLTISEGPGKQNAPGAGAPGRQPPLRPLVARSRRILLGRLRGSPALADLRSPGTDCPATANGLWLLRSYRLPLPPGTGFPVASAARRCHIRRPRHRDDRGPEATPQPPGKPRLRAVDTHCLPQKGGNGTSTTHEMTGSDPGATPQPPETPPAGVDGNCLPREGRQRHIDHPRNDRQLIPGRHHRPRETRLPAPVTLPPPEGRQWHIDNGGMPVG